MPTILDIELAARTLWQEARGEPIEGQQAVAWVLRNRTESGRWGKTLAEVCLSEYHGIYQFSGWARSDLNNRVSSLHLADNDPGLSHMRSVMRVTLDGTNDPTGGATHYFADSIEAPTWTQGAIPCGKFGRQLFFKGVK